MGDKVGCIRTINFSPSEYIISTPVGIVPCPWLFAGSPVGNSGVAYVNEAFTVVTCPCIFLFLEEM